MQILKALGVMAGPCFIAAILTLAPGRPAQAQQQRQQYYTNQSSGNVANAAATATLTASKLNLYVTGFEITGAGAATASCVNATLTGLVGGTQTYNFCAPAGAAVGIQPLLVQFTSPIPSNFNTAVVLTLPPLGSGNVNAAVNLHGYYQ
ncbi:hypothetical protein SAMN05519104_1659 [Rhizobiales bacterium GAS188]|nr:hypothetical protein SAMN05519104_1659 [Rhizobiales bacterium GAS188]